MEHKTEFIAEFCQNHNGNFEILKQMLDAALHAGATYAKIQSIFAEDLSFRERFEKGIIDKNGNVVSRFSGASVEKLRETVQSLI